LVSVGDDKRFARRLAQTIAWCSPRADLRDPAKALRSAEAWLRDQVALEALLDVEIPGTR